MNNVIRLSKIDGELSIYKSKQVIIWGTGKNSLELSKLLADVGINNITAYCDNDVKKVGESFCGKIVISAKELCEKYAVQDVLICVGSGAYEGEIIEQIEGMGEFEYLTYGEQMCQLAVVKVVKNQFYELCGQYIEAEDSVRRSSLLLASCGKVIDNKVLEYICMPRKTGNNSIAKLLSPNESNFIHTWHRVEDLDNVLKTLSCENIKIRIMTVIREPIIQNLSALYEKLGNSLMYMTAVKCVDKKFCELLLAGDVQKIYDYMIRKWYYKQEGPEIWKHTFIQDNVMEFCDNILNLLDYEFDKESGYSIISKGNVEVFVCQLEKMNEISKPICDWLGIEHMSIPRENVGANKWYDKSYQQAKKELKITQEYFDKCFNEPYVRHFYSEADIEKFKEKWRPHISDVPWGKDM